MNPEHPRSSLTALRRFFEGSLSALRVNATDNAHLVTELKAELERRQKRAPERNIADQKEQWEMFAQKLLRFRPRLIGAFGAYAALSGRTFAEVEEQGGMPLFRMLWFIGSAQDDLIDSCAGRETTPDAKQLRRAIFGPEQIFYQAAFTVIGRELDRVSMTAAQRRYIKTRLSAWFRFLVYQEADIMRKKLRELTFDACVRYREDQNQKIGEALVACLNGSRCLDPRFRALEQTVPKLSFRTQIIDDIADIPEDLDGERPSYAIGALVDHPRELETLTMRLHAHAVSKVTPALFKQLAPESSARVRAQFDAYGAALKEEGVTGAVLANMGDVMFKYFPVFRDAMYKINPKHANF